MNGWMKKCMNEQMNELGWVNGQMTAEWAMSGWVECVSLMNRQIMAEWKS